MNKFWAGLAIVTLGITGILYARGFGEGFSEHGDTLNKDNFNTDPYKNTTDQLKPIQRPPETGEKKAQDYRPRNDYGRDADNRSPWEKDENQGLIKNPTGGVSVSKPVSINKNEFATPPQVNAQVKQNFPNAAQWFTPAFDANHGLYNTNVDAWRAATWAEAAGTIGAGWGNAISYDPNGSSVEISQPGSAAYTATGQDTYMNQPSTAATTPETTVNSAPTLAENTNADHWIPLGVYALGTDTVNPADTNLFLQLSVNKAGNLQGTFYNAKTDKTETLTGNVDLSNQLVSFYIANRPDSPIISTGLYNLTQAQTAVNVIMPDTSQRTWDMVKINK